MRLAFYRGASTQAGHALKVEAGMAGSSPRPSRVLIVDDDPFAGLVLSGLCSSALEAVENSSVDLVESKSEVLEAVKAAVLAGAPLDLVRTHTRAHSITCKHAARYHERRDNSSDTLRDKRNTRLYSRTFLSLSRVSRSFYWTGSSRRA